MLFYKLEINLYETYTFRNGFNFDIEEKSDYCMQLQSHIKMKT